MSQPGPRLEPAPPSEPGQAPLSGSEWASRSGSEWAPRSEPEWMPRSGSEWALRSGSEWAPRSGSEWAPRSGSEWALRSRSEWALRSGSEWAPRSERASRSELEWALAHQSYRLPSADTAESGPSREHRISYGKLTTSLSSLFCPICGMRRSSRTHRRLIVMLWLSPRLPVKPVQPGAVVPQELALCLLGQRQFQEPVHGLRVLGIGMGIVGREDDVVLQPVP